MQITLKWKGSTYHVSMGAHEENTIVKLPDGTLLQILSWAESLPPQPAEIVELKIVSASNA